MEPGVRIDDAVYKSVLEAKVAQGAVREAQMEAAVQQGLSRVAGLEAQVADLEQKLDPPPTEAVYDAGMPPAANPVSDTG